MPPIRLGSASLSEPATWSGLDMFNALKLEKILSRHGIPLFLTDEPAGNEFSEEQKRRNFDYYDPLTTGDSSLSRNTKA